MTGDLVLAGAPNADLKAATKKYVDDADALKAPLASPALTGNPTAPTQSAGNDSTHLASTAFVAAAVTASSLIRRTAIATTSGTAHGFTSIPAGTNRLTMSIRGVGLSGSDKLMIRIGDSGGYEATNYDSRATAGTNGFSSITGFLLTSNTSVDWSGSITFTRIDGNEWVSSGVLGKAGGGNANSDVNSGAKTLSGELDRIQVVASGSNTFNAGKINIITEV